MGNRHRKSDEQYRLMYAKARSLIEHGFDCVYCGDDATVLDHLIPEHMGPTEVVDRPENLVPACAQCNQKKYGTWPTIFLWRHVPDEARRLAVERLVQRVIDTTYTVKRGPDGRPAPFANTEGYMGWDWRLIFQNVERAAGAYIAADDARLALANHRAA